MVVLASGTFARVGVLTRGEIERFVAEGFVRLDAAFTRELASAAVDGLWELLDEDRDDPSTWTSPVSRIAGAASPALDAAIAGPRLCGAIDQLVGAGRWRPRQHGYGSFPVRFPSVTDPGDAGWHIDGSFEHGDAPPPWNYWVNERSRGRALLLLMLFSDVGEVDAPTRIRVGSHLDVAAVTGDLGDEGAPFVDVAARAGHAEGRPEVLATGRAGDVYLCHPFLVHAASFPHRGERPRFIAQPPVEFADGLDGYDLDDPSADWSPVATAIRRGRDRL